MNLKAARVGVNLTQRKASKLLGVSEATLVSYEAGRTFPDVPVIKRMEKLYGVPFSELDFLCDEIPQKG